MSKEESKEIVKETESFKSCSKLRELNKETLKVSNSVSEIISKLCFESK